MRERHPSPLGRGNPETHNSARSPHLDVARQVDSLEVVSEETEFAGK